MVDAGVADPPLRHVQDPLHAHFVDGVHDGTEVRHRVLDFAPVVEAGAADHLVRHPEAHERLLDHAALGVRAVEHRHLTPVDAVVALELPHRRADPPRFVPLVLGVVADDAFAGAHVGPQRLRLAFGVVVDDRVRRVEDGLRAPVVLVEHDGGDVGERLLELQDVPEIGAAKSVHAVVHEHAVRSVRVRHVDIEVVDRTGIGNQFGRLDDRRHDVAIPLDEHFHSRQHVRQRHQVVDRPVVGQSPAQVEASDRRDTLRVAQRSAIVLPGRLVAHRSMLARAHRHAASLEALDDVGPVRRPLHTVVADRVPPIGEHREVDRRSSRAVLRTVMRKLRMKQSILHQQLRPRLGIDRSVQTLQPRVVHRQAPSERMEARGGQSVLGREEGLEVRRLGEAAAGLQDPGSISVLLVAPHNQAVLHLARLRWTGPDRSADAPASVGAVHQVDEVTVGLWDEPGGDQVVRRRGDRPAIDANRSELAVEASLVNVRDGSRMRVGATYYAEHLVTDGDRLDRHRSVRRGDERPGRQTLIRVTHYADVLVAAGQHEDHLVLGLVRVLVLVDQDVFEPLAVVLEHVAVLAEQHHRLHQQVVEVHRPGLHEAGLVLGVDVGVLAVEDVRRPACASSGSTSSFFQLLITACTPRGVKRFESRPRSRMT